MGTRKIRLADRLRTNPFSSLFNLVKTTPTYYTVFFSLYFPKNCYPQQTVKSSQRTTQNWFSSQNTLGKSFLRYLGKAFIIWK